MLCIQSGLRQLERETNRGHFEMCCEVSFKDHSEILNGGLIDFAETCPVRSGCKSWHVTLRMTFPLAAPDQLDACRIAYYSS